MSHCVAAATPSRINIKRLSRDLTATASHISNYDLIVPCKKTGPLFSLFYSLVLFVYIKNRINVINLFDVSIILNGECFGAAKRLGHGDTGHGVICDILEGACAPTGYSRL